MPLYDVRWLGDDGHGVGEWADAEGRANLIEAISARAATEQWLKMYDRRDDWGVEPPDVIAVRPAHTCEWRYEVDDQAHVREVGTIRQVENCA